MVCHRFLLNFFNDLSSQYEKDIINDYVTYTRNSGWIINFISRVRIIMLKASWTNQNKVFLTNKNHNTLLLYYLDKNKT